MNDANIADNVLKRLSIIDKAKALAWYTDVEFGAGIRVNIDKSGNGVELFYLTYVDVDNVYVYPATSEYTTQDADTLECFGGGNAPTIVRDGRSEKLERIFDSQLRYYGISKDNPIVRKYGSDSIVFPGNKSKFNANLNNPQ